MIGKKWGVLVALSVALAGPVAAAWPDQGYAWAFVAESGMQGGGMFAAGVPRNAVRAGWSAPGGAVRVYLIRCRDNPGGQLDIVQAFTPGAGVYGKTFVGVGPGRYWVGVESSGYILVASEVVEVK